MIPLLRNAGHIAYVRCPKSNKSITIQRQVCPTNLLTPPAKMQLYSPVPLANHDTFQGRAVRRSKCGTSPGNSSSTNSRPPRCAVHRNSSSQSTAYEHHCRKLESGAVLCRAKIAITPGGGGRGMVATQYIAAGDSVLEIAAANVLSVPKNVEAAGDWYKWLQLYTAAHGALPDVLVEFLSDTTYHHTIRLATWLLYLKQYCSSSSSSSSSSTIPYWCSYIAVLQQSGALTAVCSGAWQQSELQLLQPQVLRDWACCLHAAARKSVVAAVCVLQGGRHPVANLGLADESSDVAWALGLVKTRAYGDADRLSLFPLHDMVNHRERGQANLRPVPVTAMTLGVGYTLQAVRPIWPGEELTNCYTAPLSNPNMLLGWGFTTPAKAADWVTAVPLHYGTLPQIPWMLAVQAAGNVARRHQQQQGWKLHQRQQDQTQQECKEPAPSKQQQQQHNTSCSTADIASFENRNELVARLASAAANMPLQLPDSIWDGGQTYSAAAAALATQMRNLLPQQQQQQQQRPEDVFAPLIGDALQQEKIETLFHRDLQLHMQHTQQHQQQQHHEQLLQHHAARAALASKNGPQQQLQARTAAVLRAACLIQLASCNTTIAEDELLLQQLQQQHNSTHVDQPPSLQQQQQHQYEGARQILLQQLDQQQQQLVRQLALLAAYSNLRSMCEATAAAAEAVLQAVQADVEQLEQQLELPAWRQQGPGLRAAVTNILQHYGPHMTHMLEQQEAELQQLQLLQRTAGSSTQLQQYGPSACGAAAAAAPVDHDNGSSLNVDRAAAAVAARLEQKQLTLVSAQLCEELHQLLTSAAVR